MPIIVDEPIIIVTVTDLPATIQSAELVELMVRAANARAARVAPCLSVTPTDDQLDEARLVLIGAIKRWTEAGSGALQQQQAGPFGMTVDTRQRTGFNLWPSEIQQLQDICKAAGSGRRAFTVDSAPMGVNHAPLV